MPDGDNRTDGRKTAGLFTWAIFLCAAPLAYLLRDLMNHREEASCWFSMRIMVAQVLLEGKKLYEDIFDFTQPILLALLQLVLLPAWAFQKLSTSLVDQLVLHFKFAPDLFAMFAVFGCLCGSLILTFKIAKTALSKAEDTVADEVRSTILPCMLGSAIASLIVRFDFGDLQHLFSLALLPWIYMRWLRYRGVQFPRRLALTVGIITGAVVCFDLPYIFFIAAIEFTLIVLERRWKPLLAIETAAVASVVLLYIIVLLIPEITRQKYFQIVLPLRWYTFFHENVLVYNSASTTKRVDVIYSMCVAFISSLLLFNGRTLATLLTMLALLGFGLYLLEGDGLSHDLVITIFASTIVGFMAILECLRKLAAAKPPSRFKRIVRFVGNVDPKVALLCVSIVSTAAIAYSLEGNRELVRQVTASNIKKSTPSFERIIDRYSYQKQTVSVLYDTPVMYPYLLTTDRRPADFILYFRPLLVLDWMKQRKLLSEPLRKFQQKVFVRLFVNYDLRHPDLVFVCDDYCRDFIRDEKIWQRLEQRYEIPSNCCYNSGCWPREYVGFNWNMNSFIRRTLPL